MALQHTLGLPFLVLTSSNCKFGGGALFAAVNSQTSDVLSSWRLESSYPSSISLMKLPFLGSCFRSNTLRAYKTAGSARSGDGKKKKGQAYVDSDAENDSSSADQQDPELMDAEERHEWREKIREVIDMNPNVEEEIDNLERRRKMQKLLADYPLVVEEEDPDWPEDADGWGFNLGQFFDKITIKNKKKDDKYDDDKDDSDNEIVWQDDNYIRPIKDITTAEWEEAVFKDISPLIILVHNRYKRVFSRGLGFVVWITTFEWPFVVTTYLGRSAAVSRAEASSPIVGKHRTGATRVAGIFCLRRHAPAREPPVSASAAWVCLALLFPASLCN